jgi:hypothetical protein
MRSIFDHACSSCCLVTWCPSAGSNHFSHRHSKINVLLRNKSPPSCSPLAGDTMWHYLERASEHSIGRGAGARLRLLREIASQCVRSRGKETRGIAPGATTKYVILVMIVI